MPLAERRKLKGLDPARADVIFAGTAILERVMSEAEVEQRHGERPGCAMGPGMARAGRRRDSRRQSRPERSVRSALAADFALFCSCRGVLPRYNGTIGLLR